MHCSVGILFFRSHDTKTALNEWLSGHSEPGPALLNPSYKLKTLGPLFPSTVAWVLLRKILIQMACGRAVVFFKTPEDSGLKPKLRTTDF